MNDSMRLTAHMNDGTAQTIEAETAGDVYRILGAECGWYESDGEVHPDVSVGRLRGRARLTRPLEVPVQKFFDQLEIIRACKTPGRRGRRP